LLASSPTARVGSVLSSILKTMSKSLVADVIALRACSRYTERNVVSTDHLFRAPRMTNRVEERTTARFA
jgi:hypothetical protein